MWHILEFYTAWIISGLPSVLWRCWLGGWKGIRPVKTEWWGAGVIVYLEQGADLRMAQLMPLPLTVSCFSKIQIGFNFLVPAHQVVLEKWPLNGCVCEISLEQQQLETLYFVHEFACVCSECPKRFCRAYSSWIETASFGAFRIQTVFLWFVW